MLFIEPLTVATNRTTNDKWGIGFSRMERIHPVIDGVTAAASADLDRTV